MQKLFAIAWNEARMSRRNWRVWLLVSLVIGLGYFARNAYLTHIELGNYLLPAFAFWHPSFQLLMLVILLGTVTVALDICGRLSRTGMHQIMYPLPMHSLTLTIGRFLGALFIVLPIAFFGFAMLAYLQYLYGHSPVVFQPFLWAFALIVLPTVVPLAAATVLLRTIFKHDFAAILVLLAALFGLILLDGYASFLLPIVDIWGTIQHASPNLGVRLIPAAYTTQLLAHGALTLLFLMLAPLYIRRQQPQRSLIKRGKRYSWFAIPTIIRWVSDLRFDPQLGWPYRIALLATVLLCAAGLWNRYNSENQPHDRVARDGIERSFMRETATVAQIDLDTIRVDIRPGNAAGQAMFAASMDGELIEATDTLYLNLAGGYEIDSVRVNGNDVEVEQWGRVRQLALGETISANTPITIEVDYESQPHVLHPDYVSLTGNWYPAPLRERMVEGDWVEQYTDKFQAQLSIVANDEQLIAFAGTRLGTDETDAGRIERWRTDLPVSALEVYWGRFELVQQTERGIPVRFYHLPHHRYQVEVYLEEVLDQEELVRDQLGRMPFPELVFIEQPYHSLYAYRNPYRPLDDWFNPFYVDASQQSMPGLITISENALAFMNESIWDLDRFDLERSKVPFYRQLDDARDELNEQYYQELIRLYYRETLNPVGEHAFWIAWLPEYANALLEQNRWRRRYALNYTIEGRQGEPLALARSLPIKELNETRGGFGLTRKRSLGNFRMLHHLLGDDAWWEFQRALISRYAFEPISMEEFISLAEDFYGEPLDWFVEDWILSPSLPEYEITLAEAQLIEDPRNDDVTYAVSIRVKNHGTGRMMLPIYIETEMDFFYQDIWLESEMEDTVTVTVPHRPLLAVVDPLNWVLKIDYYDENLKRRTRSEKKIEIMSTSSRPTVRASRGGRGGRRGR